MRVEKKACSHGLAYSAHALTSSLTPNASLPYFAILPQFDDTFMLNWNRFYYFFSWYLEMKILVLRLFLFFAFNLLYLLLDLNILVLFFANRIMMRI